KPKYGLRATTLQQVRRERPAAIHHALEKAARRAMPNYYRAACDPGAHSGHVRPGQIGHDQHDGMMTREQRLDPERVLAHTLFTLRSVEHEHGVAIQRHDFTVSAVPQQ